MSLIATILTLGVIAWLFRITRQPHAHTSWALWIPIVWIALISSRPVTLWLHVSREVSLEDQYTEGSPVDAAVYGLLILGAALVLNWRWPLLKRFMLANIPLLLFFFYCGLSVLWSDAPPIALKRWIKAVGDLLMMFVILTDAQPRLALQRTFNRVGFVLMPMSLLFIYGIPSMGTSYDPQSHVTYYIGVTTFKNLLGVMCLFCGIGALWSFVGVWQDMQTPRRKQQLVAYAFSFLMALALIKRADSVTSLSSTLLASGVILLCSSRWAVRRPAAVFAIVVSAIGTALFALFADTVLLQLLGRNSTLTGRTQIWAAVLQQKINPLIGTGFESFWMGNRLLSVWNLSQKGIEEAHNGYLEIYLNLGWVGLALLGFVIVTGYQSAVLLFRRDPQAGRLRLGLYSGSLVFVLTEAGFRMMSPDWFAFLISVTAMPIIAEAGASSLSTRKLHWRVGANPVKILQ